MITRFCENCDNRITGEVITEEIEGIISNDVVDVDYPVEIYFCDEECQEIFHIPEKLK